MSRHHYGALVAVIAGFVLCRVLGFPIVDGAGAIGGHSRPGDVAVGVVVAAVPFAILIFYSAVRLTHRSLLLHLPAARALMGIGWFVAGAVMGLLPYSRMGTELALRTKESRTAPGFLHGMDVTIIVGLLITVALLLLALRARPDHSTSPVRWLGDEWQHEVEDDA